MALRYDKVLGEMTIVQQHDDKQVRFKIQIRRANCLAAFIHVSKNPESKGKDDRCIHTLYCFWVDQAHVNNILKEQGSLFGDEIKSVKLNLFYKESGKLVKIFTKAGYKVTCFYKQEKS